MIFQSLKEYKRVMKDGENSNSDIFTFSLRYSKKYEKDRRTIFNFPYNRDRVKYSNKKITCSKLYIDIASMQTFGGNNANITPLFISATKLKILRVRQNQHL